MNNIVLVGFMGTGKSAVGRVLARRLRRAFLDLDREIEKKSGRAIAQIFAEEGEEGFRKREAQAVKEAAALDSFVIATGGGVMQDEWNVRALKGSGTVVCLTARPEVILRRTQATLASRPLLAGGDPEEKIRELLAKRALFYARADLTLDTSDRSIAEIAEEIRQRLGL